MTVFDVILWNLAFVHLHFLFKEINGELLLEEGGAFVLLILKDAHYRRRLPFLFTARSRYSRLGQRLGDMRAGFAQKEFTIYVPHNLGFLFDNLGKSIFTFFVAQKMLVPEADLAVCKALALAPSDVVGNGTAFFLSDTGHDGNEQLAFTVQCIYALLLEVNRNAAFLQLADGGQGIDRVSGEAGDGLRKDQVDLSVKGVLDHAIEAFAPFRIGACDTLVGIDLNEYPVSTLLDLFGVIVDLSIVAGLLLLVLGRNTGIGCNTLFDYWCQRRLHEARIDRRLDDLHLPLSYLSLHSASSFVQRLFPAFQPSSFQNGKEMSISLHGLYHPSDGKSEDSLAWRRSTRCGSLQLPHHIQQAPALGCMHFSMFLQGSPSMRSIFCRGGYRWCSTKAIWLLLSYGGSSSRTCRIAPVKSVQKSLLRCCHTWRLCGRFHALQLRKPHGERWLHDHPE